MTMVHKPQTSISTNQRVSNGLRLETYLMHASIVPVLCYPAVSCWLLEDVRTLANKPADSMWHLLLSISINDRMLLSICYTCLGLG